MNRRHFTCLASDITVITIFEIATPGAHTLVTTVYSGARKIFSPRILFFKIGKRERAAVVSEYVVFVVFVFFYRVFY